MYEFEERFYLADDRRTRLRDRFDLMTKHWGKLQTRYMQATDGEHSFAFNERASVGFLAASCWANGFVAIEEFCTRKRGADDLRTRANGRGDLYVCHQDSGEEIFIEAKQTFMLLRTADSKCRKRVQSVMSEAQHDIRRCNFGGTHYAVSFIVPYLYYKDPASEEELPEYISENFDRFESIALRTEGVDAIASLRLKKVDAMKREEEERGTCVLPGCIMAIWERR